MDDPTSLLFGLGCFTVAEVARVGDGVVQIVIETGSREAAYPRCGGPVEPGEGSPRSNDRDLWMTSTAG